MGRSLPNSYFTNENISNKTSYSVRTIVSDRVESFWKNKMILTIADETLRVDPVSLGIEIEDQATVDNIVNYGKSGNLRNDFLILTQAPFFKLKFAPSFYVDFAKLSFAIDQLVAKYETPVVDSSIVFEGNGPRISESEFGLVVDRSKLTSDLIKSIEDLSSEPIAVRFIAVAPKSGIAEAEAALEKVKSLQNQSIVINFERDSWKLEGKKLIGLLRFYPEGYEYGYFMRTLFGHNPVTVHSIAFENEDKRRLQILLDREELEKFVQEIAGRVDRQTVNATLKFDGARVAEFVPARDGQKVNVQVLKERILQRISIDNINLEPQISLTLPIDVETAKIANEEINSLGIRSLIGKGVSYFAGSIPNRISNLALVSKRISGSLVAPNEIFSFNKSAGEISGATGYKPAYVISQGRTVLDDGGGVCQISTTIFRAALNTGLPIVARTAHAYRVSFYEQGGFKPGFDATVWSPAVDLQFKNDTDHHILVQIVVDPIRAKVEVDIYGTGDGRKTEITEPLLSNFQPPLPDKLQDDPTLPKGTIKQVDFAASGITSVFGRKVFRGDELLIDEKFTSRFRPWQAIFLVGTGG